MNIVLKPEKIARFLLLLTAFFTLAHIAGQVAYLSNGPSLWLYLFDLDREQSIPRFFSVTLLLLCAGLIGIIVTVSRQNNLKDTYYWLGLGVVFLGFAIFKNNSFSVSPSVIIRSAFNISRIQLYALVYGFFLIVFPLIYLKFFFRLSTRMKVLLVSGAFFYIGGAVALDLVSAYLSHLFGQSSVFYLASATLEEVLEMVGIVVFVYTFLFYVSFELKTITIKGALQAENGCRGK